MFLLKMIRKVFSLFRSGLTAHEIALGFCLGILAGTIPFSSFCALIAVLLVMVVLRASFTAFFVGAGLTKLLGFAVIPACYGLGGVALEGPLRGLFGALARTPVLALLDLHRYVVAGGILFAILSSIVLYPFLRFLVNRYRRSLIAWSEKSPKWQAFTRNKAVGFFSWLLLGKKGDYEAALEARKSPFRKGAIIALICAVAGLWLFSFLFGDALAKAGFEKGMAAAFDADVSLDKAGISIVGGSLEFDNLLIRERTGKGEITHTTLLKGDLDAGELWKKHLLFDEVALERVRFRAARDKDGRFNLGGGRHGKKARARPPGPRPEAAFSHLGDLWKNRELGEDIVDKLLDVLFPKTDPEARAAEEEKNKRELEDLERYTDIYAEDLIREDRPLVVIRDLWIRGLDLMLADERKGGKADGFSGLTLHATNLSSNPGLLGRDSVIELFSGPSDGTAGSGTARRPFSLKLILKWSSPRPTHLLSIRFHDMPAKDVAGRVNTGGTVRIDQGTIDLDGKGELLSDAFSLKCSFLLKNLVFRPARKGEKILGLDGDTFCKGLNAYLTSSPLPLEVDLDGAYTSPSVRVDEKALLEAVKKGAALAAQKIAGQKIEEGKKKAKKKVDEKIEEGKKKIEEKIGGKIGDLFGKKKKKKK